MVHAFSNNLIHTAMPLPGMGSGTQHDAIGNRAL